MTKKIVFDAYALLELLEDGEGAQTVADYLADSEVGVYLSTINLGEVYYIILRRRGEQAAREVLDIVFLDEGLTLVEANWDRIKSAAALKAKGGLSFADCFVLALGIEERAPVLTGDPDVIGRAEKLGVKAVGI